MIWRTAFVDPPRAITIVIAFSKASFVIISDGFISFSSRSIIAIPASTQSWFFDEETASWLELPGRLIPNASIAEAIVFAVYIPPHEPGPSTDISSKWINSSLLIIPFENSPTFSETVT